MREASRRSGRNGDPVKRKLRKVRYQNDAQEIGYCTNCLTRPATSKTLCAVCLDTMKRARERKRLTAHDFARLDALREVTEWRNLLGHNLGTITVPRDLFAKLLRCVPWRRRPKQSKGKRT